MKTIISGDHNRQFTIGLRVILKSRKHNSRGFGAGRRYQLAQLRSQPSEDRRFTAPEDRR